MSMEGENGISGEEAVKKGIISQEELNIAKEKGWTIRVSEVGHIPSEKK